MCNLLIKCHWKQYSQPIFFTECFTIPLLIVTKSNNFPMNCFAAVGSTEGGSFNFEHCISSKISHVVHMRILTSVFTSFSFCSISSMGLLMGRIIIILMCQMMAPIILLPARKHTIIQIVLPHSSQVKTISVYIKKLP